MTEQEYQEIQEVRSGTGNLEISLWTKDFVKKYSKYLVEPILDIGCCNGAVINLCKFMGMFAMGVDISRKSSGNCISYHKLPAVNCNAENGLPFPDKVFKTVTMFHMLEHARYPEKVVEHVGRVLDGNVCVILPLGDHSRDGGDIVPGHFACIPEHEDLEKLFIDNDFKIIVSEKVDSGWLLIAKNNKE